MKLSAKKSTDNAVEKSIDFEITLQHLIKKSERRAWIVALCACTVSIFLALGYFFILPLKEKVPYLVMADPYTGTSSLSKLTENFQNPDLTQNEAINKSNVAHYIISRESYDWDLIGRRDWVTVHSMSSPIVVKSYQDQFIETNLSNPDKVYGRSKSVRVKIKTIVLLAPDATGKFTAATVRFDKITFNKQLETIESVESYIATIAFEYKSNLKMQEDYRVENPLGFRVEAYRVDPEVVNNSKALVLKEITNTAASGDVRPIPGASQ